MSQSLSVMRKNVLQFSLSLKYCSIAERVYSSCHNCSVTYICLITSLIFSLLFYVCSLEFFFCLSVYVLSVRATIN